MFIKYLLRLKMFLSLQDNATRVAPRVRGEPRLLGDELTLAKKFDFKFLTRVNRFIRDVLEKLERKINNTNYFSNA